MLNSCAFRIGRFLIIALVAALSLATAGSDLALADDASEWLAKSFSSKSSSAMSRLGAPIGEPRATRKRSPARDGVKVASLGGGYAPKPILGPSLSGGGNVNWVASAGCLNSSLRSIVNSIAASYGSVTVSSTCRNRAHNARVGGATKSHHLTGDAVDFRVRGNWGGALATLRGHWGGFKHYGGGLFHIDTGAKRSW